METNPENHPDTKHPDQPNHSDNKKLAILLCILVLVSLLFWLLTAYQFKEARSAYRNAHGITNQINVDEENFHLPGRNIPGNFGSTTAGGTSGAASILSHKLTPAEIQPWMTFNYLNYEFGLASTTLKQDLDITDRHYPKMSIYRFAGEMNVSSAAALKEVQDTIQTAVNK